MHGQRGDGKVVAVAVKFDFVRHVPSSKSSSRALLALMYARRGPQRTKRTGELFRSYDHKRLDFGNHFATTVKLCNRCRCMFGRDILPLVSVWPDWLRRVLERVQKRSQPAREGAATTASGPAG